MADFNNFWEDVKAGIKSLAESNFIEIKDKVIAAGNEFLFQSEDDIKLWTVQLADEQIDKDEFEWLIKSKSTTAKLMLLKQKGIAKAQADKITGGILDLIISSSFKCFL